MHDFGDQILFPLLYNLSLPTPKHLFKDEFQDFGDLDYEMVRRMTRPGYTRCYGFGDPFQSIYGFRGASETIIAQYLDEYNATDLPLSISFRCPQSVIAEANKINPNITAREGAEEGHVFHDEVNDDILSNLDRNCLFICRNNAPLIRTALKLLKWGIPFRYKPDFANSIAAFLRSLKAQDLTILRDRLLRWVDEERSIIEKEEKYYLRGYVEDKFSASLALLEMSTDIDDIFHNVRRLAASETGVRLSTIHGAKGTEADHIYFFRPDLVPSPYAKSEGELRQERNLRYVAITRAKQSLTYLYKPED
jgi:superfamily I DNA/RNA helicase